jgi:hypothetical protein
MKKNLVTIFISLVLLAGCSVYLPSGELETGYPRGGRYGEVDIGFFYDYLSPFGTWVEFSPYGYVWCPSYLGYGWRPYSNGHWLWTDYGWTWFSDYDWGWVPFHYGRWDWDDGLGWFWVPDNIWGPAWVTWCWNDMYIGWAPLPAGVDFIAGVGISGFSRRLPSRFWCFVQGPHFLAPDMRRYVLPFERNATIFNYGINRGNITVYNNRIFNGGVGIDEVQRLTRHRVTRFRLEDAGRPGRMQVEGGMVRIYRPPILRNEAARPRAFVPRSEAPQRLPEMRGQAPERGEQPAEIQKRLREDHNQERRLLEQSQQAEREQLRRQQEDGARRAANAAERERVNRETQARQREVQQRHAEERAQMEQRHQEEERNAGRQEGRQPQQQPRRKGKG